MECLQPGHVEVTRSMVVLHQEQSGISSFPLRGSSLRRLGAGVSGGEWCCGECGGERDGVRAAGGVLLCVLPSGCGVGGARGSATVVVGSRCGGGQLVWLG